MADLSYNVRVNTQQAQQSIGSLRTALGGLAAAFSIRQVVQFGDSITSLQNKLRTLTPNLALVDRQFKAIADIAGSSRTSLESTGDLYFRIARASTELGISLADAAQITDTLSKGLASSGLSAQEAAGPLLQLGQALQSGRFQGDELRSILEGMPVVTRALADELGVTVGELRDLGSEGKITGDVFVRAMQNSRAAIVEAFGRTAPTIGQSFEQIRTSVALFFVEFERNTGFFAAFAQNVQSIARSLADLSAAYRENEETIKGLVKVLGILAGAYLIASKGVKIVQAAQSALIAVFGLAAAKTSVWTKITGGATNAARNFGKAFGWVADTSSKLNKFGLVLAGAGAALRTLLRALGIVGLIYGLVTAIDELIKYFLKFSVIDWVVGKLKDFAAWLGITSSAAKAAAEKTTQATQAEVRAVDNAIDAYNRKAEQQARVIKITDELATKLREISEGYEQSRRSQMRDIEANIARINLSEDQIRMMDALMAAEDTYRETSRQLNEELLAAEKELAERRKTNANVTSQAVDAIRAKIQELDNSYNQHTRVITDMVRAENAAIAVRRLHEFTVAQQIRVEDELQRIQRETARDSMTEIQRKYADIRDAADDSARAAIRAEEARRGAPLSTTEIENYYKVARTGIERLQRATEAQIRQQRSFSAGWAKAYRDYADAATNAATRAQNIFSKTMQGMEDLIVNFARTGKFEFRDFVNSILEELLRSQIREVMASIFNPQGGIFGGLGELFGAVMGGGKGGTARGNSPSQPLYVQQVGGGGATGAGGGINLGSLTGILGQQRQPTVSTPGFGGGQSRGGSILDTITKTVSGIGSVLGSAGSWINKNIFGGFFATGGLLPAGKIGIVGERGPEMISGPASITPMMPTQVTYNINAVDAASFQALLARDPRLIYSLTEQGRKSFAGAR